MNNLLLQARAELIDGKEVAESNITMYSAWRSEAQYCALGFTARTERSDNLPFTSAFLMCLDWCMKYALNIEKCPASYGNLSEPTEEELKGLSSL